MTFMLTINFPHLNNSSKIRLAPSAVATERKCYGIMLVSTGVELMNFTLADMGAVFWICAKWRVDNIEMFLLMLSRVYTELKPFLLFCHTGEEIGSVGGVGWGHSQGR